MPFSWKAILLAPLMVPVIVAVWMSTDVAKGQSSLGMFALFLAMGGVVSYGATVFILLPALFVVSRFARLTAVRMMALAYWFLAHKAVP